MALPLRSGDPPASDDPELVDAGTFRPQQEISNAPGSGSEGDIDMYDVYGVKIPKWAQVREVLMKTRDLPKPLHCKVVGVGVLYVGEEGGEVRSE